MAARWQILTLGVAILTLGGPPADGGQAAPTTFTLAIQGFQHDTMDPALAQTPDLIYQSPMYDPLVGTAPSGELTPARGLAESWSVSPDAKKWTFRLRRNVKWHDGKSFTADDVVFSFNERYKAANRVCSFCGIIEKEIADVRAVDSHTVEFTLRNPSITFLEILNIRDGNSVVVPRHAYRKAADGSLTLAGDPIGTGPFKFQSFQRGVAVTYTANKGYWDPSRVPQVDRLVILNRPEAATRMAMVQSGEADMALVEAGQVQEARSKGLQVISSEGASLTVMYYAWSYNPKFLCHQQWFREAMTLAIDMDAIVGRLFPEGTATRIASSIWTPPALGYDPNLKPYPYNPQRAKQLLQTNGYRGTPVILWSAPLSASPETPQILQLVQAYLEAAGIKAEFRPIEYGQFLPMIRTAPQRLPTDVACNVYVNVPFPRPLVIENIGNSWISIEAGGRHGGYWDAKYLDAKYRELREITDLDRLKEELLQLNRKTYSEYAFNPVVARAALFVAGPRVRSWQPGKYGNAWHLETIQLQSQAGR
jgi:ABC-type transport system substrate-binding protein